jgi:hypothetical protein
MRKATRTDSAKAWGDWDELTLGNKESRDKLTKWKDQCRSKMIAKVSDGDVCTPDQARDGWLEILEEGFKTETGENGLETITLRDAYGSPDQTSSSSSTKRGLQGLSEKITARHPINPVTDSGPTGTVKTFSGGAEVSASRTLSL